MNVGFLLVAGLAGVIASVGAGEARTLVQNKGSDTLVNVAQAWAEAYRAVNPDVAVAVSGGGSGTGIAAMINGTVDIANASRAMTDRELAMARSRGQAPVQHVVAYDALAVFVHQANPLVEISIPELAEVFGEGGATVNWRDLGVEVPRCRGQEMILVSRQNNSGTYAYFRQAVLGKRRDYKLGTLDMHGSRDVVALVEKTPCAIGYSGMAYASDKVRMLCISAKKGEPCVTPSAETAADRTYPIARPLFMYTNGEPTGANREYLDWILSDVGQCIILRKGYAPARSVTCN